jgi:hypothetical protein
MLSFGRAQVLVLPLLVHRIHATTTIALQRSADFAAVMQFPSTVQYIQAHNPIHAHKSKDIAWRRCTEPNRQHLQMPLSIRYKENPKPQTPVPLSTKNCTTQCNADTDSPSSSPP